MLAVLAVLILAFVACGSDGAKFERVEDVVAVLDQHTLTGERESLYQIIGAFDGAKFDVSPGDYTIELYVYRARGNMPSLDILETADSQVHAEGDILLILHTSESSHLEAILADLRDG